MRKVAALLDEKGLAGKKVLLMACFSGQSAQELASLREVDDPNAAVWGWPGLLTVSSGTGNAAGGDAHVNAIGRLVVTKPEPLRRYLPSGAQATNATTEQAPLPTLTADDLASDIGPWHHRGHEFDPQVQKGTVPATIEDILSGRIVASNQTGPDR